MAFISSGLMMVPWRRGQGAIGVDSHLAGYPAPVTHTISFILFLLLSRYFSKLPG